MMFTSSIGLWLWLSVSISMPMVRGQRGGYDGSGRGSWGEDSVAQAQIVTETQLQTRTMVSTAPAQAPTTIVQATTVLRVSTVQVQVPAEVTTVVSISDRIETSIVTPAVTSNPPSSVPQSPSASSVGGDDDLTVDPLDSGPGVSQSSTTATNSSADNSLSTSSTIPGQSQTQNTSSMTSSSAMSSTVDLPDVEGMKVETTGIPNTRNSAGDVVYGHVSSSFPTRSRRVRL